MTNKKKFKVYLLLLVFTTLSLKTSAQVAADNKGTFLYTGVSMDIPNSDRFLFYYGYSPSDDFQSLIALPFFKISKDIQFMPGYMMTKADGEPMFTNVDHHLLPSIIFNFRLSDRFTFTDRNMWYHLFRDNLKDINFYRNRFGLIYHNKVFKKPTNLFIHNAIFLNLDNGKLFRNRLILGGSIKAAKWITPQIWYAYQAENGILPQHQFYLILTIPLENIGILK